MPYRIILPNQVTLLLDSDARWHSASCALVLRCGQRSEEPRLLGVTHLLEHLLFKRTSRRDRLGIARLVDELGADVNAFTDSDSLCLHGTAPHSSILELLFLFSDLVLDAQFSEEDVALEREIVRQEILEAQEDPLDLVFQLFREHFWPGGNLAIPVFGRPQTVEHLSLNDVQQRRKAMLFGSRIIVAAAGRVDEVAVEQFMRQQYLLLTPGEREHFAPPVISSGVVRKARESEQVQLVLGCPWPSMLDPDYLKGELVISLLGEGLSSRLFQVLRETHGLVYDVSADLDAHADVAALQISVVVERSNLTRVLQLLFEELQSLRDVGVAEDELQRVVRMRVATAEMECDSINARLWRMIASETIFGRYISNQETIAKVLAINAREIKEMLEKWLIPGRFLLALCGDVKKFRLPAVVDEWCGKR